MKWNKAGGNEINPDFVWVVSEFSPSGGVTIDEPILGVHANRNSAILSLSDKLKNWTDDDYEKLTHEPNSQLPQKNRDVHYNITPDLIFSVERKQIQTNELTV